MARYNHKLNKHVASMRSFDIVDIYMVIVYIRQSLIYTRDGYYADIYAIYKNLLTYIYIYHINIYQYIYIYIYIYISIYISQLYIYIYVCVCVCACAYVISVHVTIDNDNLM